METIHKNLQQQKYASVFLADTQCEQFGHFNKNIYIAQKRLHEQVL